MVQLLCSGVAEPGVPCERDTDNSAILQCDADRVDGKTHASHALIRPERQIAYARFYRIAVFFAQGYTMGITPIPAVYRREILWRRDDALAVNFENREAEGSGGNARASRTWKGAM